MVLTEMVWAHTCNPSTWHAEAKGINWRSRTRIVGSWACVKESTRPNGWTWWSWKPKMWQTRNKLSRAIFKVFKSPSIPVSDVPDIALLWLPKPLASTNSGTENATRQHLRPITDNFPPHQKLLLMHPPMCLNNIWVFNFLSLSS